MNATPSSNAARPARRSAHPLMLATALVTFGLALALYLPTAAPTISERFGGVDGGELAAVALSGGVPHPSGYPTYMLLARAALRLLPGEPAYRLAVLSALAMAAAAACTSLVVWLLAPASLPVHARVLPSMAAALLFAWSPRAWSQAIIVEVYAVYLLFLSLALLLIVAWVKTRRAALLVLGGGVVGLGTGAHLTILAVVVGVVVMFGVARRRLSGRLLLATCAAFGAGCTIYLYLPVWAARGVIPSWGDATTLAGWWWHVSGAEYHYLVGIVPWSQRLGRLGFAARDLLSQLWLVGPLLALWFGFAYGWDRERGVLFLTGTVALLGLLFAVGYGAADGEVYLLPWTWFWCVLAGMGVFRLLASPSPATPRFALKWSVAGPAALLVLIGVSAAWRYPALDLHADTGTRDRAVARLEALEHDALLVTADDAATFGAWYVQTALDVRPDVVPVDLRLLGRPWYDAQLRRRLGVSDATPLCDALQASGRPLYAIARDGATVEQPIALWSSVAVCSR